LRTNKGIALRHPAWLSVTVSSIKEDIAIDHNIDYI